MQTRDLTHAHREYRGEILTLLLSSVSFLFVLLCLHSITRVSLFSHDLLDSYTWQALAWRRGALSLGGDIPYLELAIFGGDFYVSFPPVPTLPMLLLTFIFGEDTPNTLMVTIYALLSFCVIQRLLSNLGRSDFESIFWSTFLVLGSNMVSICMSGGVWYQAQALSFLLCCVSIRALFAHFRGSRVICLLALALAVGCRPFQIIYFPLLYLFFYQQDRAQYAGEPLKKTVYRLLPLLLPPLAIGLAYMGFNFARFGNVLEFGHNYLPEFTRSQNGQFSLAYLGDNLMRNLFSFPWLSAEGLLEFHPFGFAFYIANPLFVVLFVRFFGDMIKKRVTLMQGLTVGLITLHLLLLCLHKTMGGWQFGARYTADALPFALVALLFALRRQEVGRFEMTAGILALALNLYGAVALPLFYS